MVHELRRGGPLDLEVVQERCDHVRAEVVDAQLTGRPAAVMAGEGEQQPEGVPVGGNRVRTGVTLADHSLGEETLQHGGNERHRCASVSSRRAQARAINSGAADKYQLFRLRNNWYLSAAPELLALAAARQDTAWSAARS
jgi:hypothetical protein